MKSQITKIIQDHPKNFSIIVNNNPEIKKWVKDNTLVKTDNISEMMYSAIHQIDNICKNNKIKKFKSINSGYGFCNRAGQCACAAEAVSAKVKQTKSLVSIESKNKSNEKRKNTTLLRYGVTNVGQTKLAITNHKEYYNTLPKKIKKVPLTSYQKLNNKYIQLSNVEFLTPESEYQGVSNQIYYQFRCRCCNNSFYDYIDNGHTPNCKICNPYNPSYISNQEIEVYEYVKSITTHNVIQTDKSIINPYELDIVIPDLKIAIEYCGLYWHSEINKSDKNYHLDKAMRCQSKGYRLITIFEDEWVQKKEIVKNRLKSIIGVNQKFYGRKCSAQLISSNIAAEFIEKHHIQGNAVFKIAYGCFYNNTLVAVMTFGKPRYDKNFEYELIRYCSIGNVIGGASKLFSKFVKDYAPTSIVSYCDMRWGTGQLYQQLGFNNVTQKLTSSYSYTNFIKRFHRSAFTKKILVNAGGDTNKTENELAKEKKLYKIWDCGQSKWSYTKS